jgi:hypothetical protein
MLPPSPPKLSRTDNRRHEISRLPMLAKGSPCRSRSPCRAPLLRSAAPGRSAPHRSGSRLLARADCTAATQPSAELAAGLTWAAVGTGQATATINKHVLVYHRTPILWTRARAAHSPLGGLGGRPATGPDPPVAKAGAQPGPAAALWLRTATRLCGAGGPIGPAVAGGFAREGARVSSVPGRSLQVPQLRRGRWSRPCWAGARRRPGCGLVAMTPSTVARRVCEQCS